MDKILKICLGLLTIILVAFGGLLTYTAYTEITYRNTLEGTYTYTCTITTDAPLYNVTLFIPVPVDPAGNSPMVSRFSNRMMNGVPADWETILFDTGKSTLLKITTPAIPVPEGTTTSHPYIITFSSETASRTPVETRDPAGTGVMFRPPQDLREYGCPAARDDGSSRCFTYNASAFADYSTSADTFVTITSAVDGKNTWTVFEPQSNEYHTDISIGMKGENHGWVVPEGTLSSGTGTYDIPAGA
ncbi:MAG: hypothetical protein WC379_03975 [Methanoregula sp.]